MNILNRALKNGKGGEFYVVLFTTIKKKNVNAQVKWGLKQLVPFCT